MIASNSAGNATAPSMPQFAQKAAQGSTAARNASNVLGQISSITRANNAASAAQAARQMDYQTQSQQAAMAFNAKEAEKNRNWQERMSSTAFQRQVADLKAAGLNPVLAAMNLSGAATTSGASASVGSQSGAMGMTDTSGTAGIVSFLGQLVQQMTQLETARVSAESNQAVADKYTAASKYTAELASQTSLTTSSISAAASRYAADMHLEASKESAAATKAAAAIHAAAAKYGYDVSAMTTQQVAAFNAQVNKEMQAAGFQHEFDLKQAFPSNMWSSLNSMLQGAGIDGFSGLGSMASDLGSALGSGKSISEAWNYAKTGRYGGQFGGG